MNIKSGRMQPETDYAEPTEGFPYNAVVTFTGLQDLSAQVSDIRNFLHFNHFEPHKIVMVTRVNYRKMAFEAYDPLCAHCGFGIPAVLEVAHIDGHRTNNEISNLVILCPNCHKMLDLDLISNETIIQMRDRPKIVTWSKRMKDAGQKAALTRKRSAAAKKAVATRKRNQSEQS